MIICFVRHSQSVWGNLYDILARVMDIRDHIYSEEGIGTILRMKFT